ncbi:callose synthase 9 [Senna tora]|uniref:Callose synthase 9 n=1 Tax=Senna tora TaxID=362788 RepID=A0A834T0Y2_9FABA|nr:callose synthase 9 [Senna tora]
MIQFRVWDKSSIFKHSRSQDGFTNTYGSVWYLGMKACNFLSPCCICLSSLVRPPRLPVEARRHLSSSVKQKLDKREVGTIDRSQDIARLQEFYKRYREKHNVDQLREEEKKLRESGTIIGQRKAFYFPWAMLASAVIFGSPNPTELKRSSGVTFKGRSYRLGG